MYADKFDNLIHVVKLNKGWLGRAPGVRNRACEHAPKECGTGLLSYTNTLIGGCLFAASFSEFINKPQFVFS